MMIIYKLTNKINGKIYIGCTTKTLEWRWSRHLVRRNDKTLLARAIRKYGAHGFDKVTIEICMTLADMYMREIFWVNYFKSNDLKIGYNLTNGGDVGPIHYGEDHWNFGKKNTKLSEFNRKRRGIKLTKEHIDNVIKSMKGRKRNKATKNKMSLSRKKAWDNGMYENVADKISKSKMGVRSNKRISILCLNNYKVYDGYNEAGIKLNISPTHISNVVNGRNSDAKGFKFQKLSAEHLIF